MLLFLSFIHSSSQHIHVRLTRWHPRVWILKYHGHELHKCGKNGGLNGVFMHNWRIGSEWERWNVSIITKELTWLLSHWSDVATDSTLSRSHDVKVTQGQTTSGQTTSGETTSHDVTETTTGEKTSLKRRQVRRRHTTSLKRRHVKRRQVKQRQVKRRHMTSLKRRH